MAAKMLLAQPRGFSDNTKNALKLSENKRDIKIIQDKKVVSYLDDFTPTALAEENDERLVDSQKMANMTMSRVGSRKFRNGKLETRYRTSSTDSAFSEESFVDLDSDESTKLESLIDQLIFTDDRLNSDNTIYTRPENLPSTDSNILDVGDLFSNTDIFTVDFESLTHDTYTPNFIESEVRPDAESTESLSSISSTESGKGSIEKYPMKMSAFLESHLDKVLNNTDTFASERFTKCSSNVFTSSDEDDVIEYGGGIGTEKIAVFNSASVGASGSDCCDNDSVHENSFVDLSTLLDISSYGRPLSVEGNLPVDSESHLNADDDENIRINESNNVNIDYRNARKNDSISLESQRAKITMATIGGVTSKTSNKSKDCESGIQLTEVYSWSRTENQKPETSFFSIKNKREKSTDISGEKSDKTVDKNINERNEYSQESLYLHSLEKLCGYADQEMSCISQNNNVCHFRDYNDPENIFTFKNTARTTHSVEDDRQLLTSPEDKRPEIKFSNRKDIAVTIDDSKAFAGEKWIDIDEPVLPFDTKSDMSSHLNNSEIFKDIDFANIDEVRSMATRVFSNEDYVKGVIAKDHSYRVQIPDSHEEINMYKTGTKEKHNRINRFNNPRVKKIPAKRPLAEDVNSVKRELTTSKEDNSPGGRCFSSYAEFPHLEYSLEDESSVLTEPSLQKSANNNHYDPNHSDSFGCLKRKVPKFSIIENDKTGVQPAILYKILAMGHHSSTDPFSSPSCLPVTVQNHCDSQSPKERSLKNHCLNHLRQETDPKREISIQAKNEQSEMGELEKYLRGIIPTEHCDEQNEVLADHEQDSSNLIIHMSRQPCSFLKKLLTGEMTAQMYRQIDRQFYENELLIQNEANMK